MKQVPTIEAIPEADKVTGAWGDDRFFSGANRKEEHRHSVTVWFDSDDIEEVIYR